ncbi:MAG: two-component sensor histidine kinase [Actinotalea sp.]|nr:two-component sensor histidine kinase [Actinotalea sp.]
MVAVVAALLVVAALGGVVGALVARARAGAPSSPSAGPGPDGLDRGATEVLAALRSAVVVAEKNARVVRASPTARTVGLVRDDRFQHAVLERMVLDVAADGRVRDEELELPRSAVGGGTVVMQVRVAMLGDHHVMLLAEDRTEARRLEAIRRDFVVNISHELKTPVGALALLSETVQDAADDPDAVRRFAGRMQTEAARLAALVQEVIQLSRLQVSDPLTAASRVDLAEVVHEAADRARTTATGKDIEVDVGDVPAGAVVLGSHDLLVTAVRNLLDNAVAYSEPGTRVAVGTTLRPDADAVELAVVDQGIGIPAAALPRLFERFYRVDPARSRETGGTGLGLSIVKHVVADHGGEVSVWSQLGHGSTFTVRLPLAPDALAGSGAPAGPPTGRPAGPSDEGVPA